MKSLLSTLAIVSLIGIGVFGALFMGIENHGHNQSGCLAAAAQGAACPDDNTASFLGFHTSFLRSFAFAVFSLIGSLLAVSLLAFRGAGFLESQHFFYSVYEKRFSFIDWVHFWLGLREHSPTYI